MEIIACDPASIIGFPLYIYFYMSEPVIYKKFTFVLTCIDVFSKKIYIGPYIYTDKNK